MYPYQNLVLGLIPVCIVVFLFVANKIVCYIMDFNEDSE